MAGRDMSHLGPFGMTGKSNGRIGAAAGTAEPEAGVGRAATRGCNVPPVSSRTCHLVEKRWKQPRRTLEPIICRPTEIKAR